ncbi:amidohydrolase family protein, partial [bacterium]|nr:amidohydrolase family protein [bacterium]
VRRIQGRQHADTRLFAGGSGGLEHLDFVGDRKPVSALRFEEARAFGSALVEAKSGYGLTVADEIKMLEAAAAAGKKARVRVLPTLYASNASPPDQTGSDAWVRAIAEDLIPEAATRRLARAVCVRVGDSGFAPDDVRAIASAARAHDLPLRLRLSAASRESVELALELGAHAIEFAGDLASAAPCAESVIVSPVDHFLRGYERADLRGLIDAGACLALSTGTEPGFGRACSMPFAIALACKRLGLSVAESIVAATYGAARALGVDDEYGAIVPGRRTPLLAIDLPSWEALPYAIADIPRAQLIG